MRRRGSDAGAPHVHVEQLCDLRWRRECDQPTAMIEAVVLDDPVQNLRLEQRNDTLQMGGVQQAVEGEGRLRHGRR